LLAAIIDAINIEVVQIARVVEKGVHVSMDEPI